MGSVVKLASRNFFNCMSAAMVPLGLCAQQARGLRSSTCQSESLGPCSQKPVGWGWVWGVSVAAHLSLCCSPVGMSSVSLWTLGPLCVLLWALMPTQAVPLPNVTVMSWVLPGGLDPRCGKSLLHGGSSQCKANARPCSVLSEAWFSLLLQRECWLLCEMGTM